MSSPSGPRWRCLWRWCSPRSRRRSRSPPVPSSARSSPPVWCCWPPRCTSPPWWVSTERPTPSNARWWRLSLVAAGADRPAGGPGAAPPGGVRQRARLRRAGGAGRGIADVRRSHVARRAHGRAAAATGGDVAQEHATAPCRDLDGERRGVRPRRRRPRPQRHPAHPRPGGEHRRRPHTRFGARLVWRCGSLPWPRGVATATVRVASVAHQGELLGFIVVGARGRLGPRRGAGSGAHRHRPAARAALCTTFASTPRSRRASTSSSCATSSSPPPAPGSSPPPTRAGATSSATCTTAPSSTWWRWR